ncbi:MAG: AAA family ATPase [Thermoplasmata archaeon]
MGSRPERPRSIILALEGPSGAGKTTLSRRLAAEMDALLVEEAYDRLKPVPSLAFAGSRDLLRLERRLLQEESRRFVEATREASEGHAVVMDTGPMGPLEYVAGLVVAGWPVKGVLASLVRDARRWVREGKLGLADLEVYVDVPPAIAFRRSQRRAPRVEMEFVERHFAVDRVLRPLWRGPWRESLGSRLVWVPGLGSVTEVTRRVLRSVDPSPQAPRSDDSLSTNFLRTLLSVRPPGASGNR